MSISPMDEFLAHQTPDTFDRVFTSDRNFYDRYYFNMHDSTGDFFMVAGMGQYPNLGVTDAFVTISHGTNQYVVRACLLYTSPSPRDQRGSRMPSSA